MRKHIFAAVLFAMTPVVSYASSDAYEHYLHGLIAERKGDIATALSDYEKAVELDPQAIEVYRDIAQLNLRTGRTEAALRAAQRVRDLAPTTSSSFLFLGHVYVARGDVAMAAQEYEKALKLEPRNLKALENLANYYSAINSKKAMEYYNRYLQIEPHDAEIFFQVGFLHQKEGDSDAAIGAFKKSIKYDPYQIASHLALAELYEAQHSTAAAVEQYELCEQLDPRNPTFYSRLGQIYFNAKRWEDAEKQFQAARALAPQDAAHQYYLARIAEERKQWKEAGVYAEEAYKLSQDPQFLPLVAYYLTMQQRTADAIYWLEKARELEPQSPNVLLFLGMDYLEIGKLAKAREILEAGVNFHPKDTQMRFQLGIAYDRLKQFDKAVKEFETVLQQDPKNAPTLNYLGYSYADRGIRLEEAEKYIQRAVDIEPENGAYWDSLGWTHYKQGKSTEAVSDLNRAVLYSQDALIYDHLGDAYRANQNLDRAMGAWAKALALDPKNKVIQKKKDEAARQVLAINNQRKYLKYIEGNFRQISNLKGSVQVTGRWKKTRLKTQGGVYYLRPDKLLLAVGTAPSGHVWVRGQKVQIAPKDLNEQWKVIALEGLTWLPPFFAGKLASPLDNPSVVVKSDKTELHYRGATEEAWVDPSRGVLARYIRQNPEGGRDKLVVESYDLVEGLWLPRKMKISNDEQKWQAELIFSEWLINEPTTAQAFDKLPLK